MDPDSTTTMGLLEFVAIERPFHSMNAVERTRAKLSTWAMECRAEARLPVREDSMAG